jgi:hypothetical protein
MGRENGSRIQKVFFLLLLVAELLAGPDIPTPPPKKSKASRLLGITLYE